MISILQPGLHTLIQDAGRPHYRSYGMPLSGVLDTDAYRLANWLVGNTKQEAVLEITLKGPVLKFHSAAIIGITGADLQPLLNGKPVPTNQTLSVPKDAVLQFGKCITGCRAYLAFSGGLCLPKMMGSTATYTEAKVGGLSGVPLQKGDCIPLGNPKAFQLRKVPSRLHCKATKTLAVRVLPGPENTLFDKESLVSFETSEYRIATASNRMGYRMEGSVLQTFQPVNLLSSGIVPGTIQVPPNGQPIVLLADAQTTGGYPRIANVISADLSFLAQQKPGDFLRFRMVTLAQAHDLWIQKENMFVKLMDVD